MHRGGERAFGVEIIRDLQSWANPVLDYFFIFLSFLGTEEFFLVAVPLVYWLYEKRLGFALGVLFCSSAFLNNFLKGLFALPRPPATEVRVLYASSGTGYGFPSGHAQNSTVFWGLLARRRRSRYAWAAAGILVALIGFSRLYLGLHYLADVLGGMGIGAALLAVFLLLERRGADAAPGSAPWSFLAATLLGLFFYRTEVALKVAGALAGMGLGYSLEETYLDFKPRGPAGRQVTKGFLGVAALAVVYLAGKTFLPPWPLVTLLRYFVLSLGGFFAVPWLFRRLGWG